MALIVSVPLLICNIGTETQGKAYESEDVSGDHRAIAEGS